jgi:outer membrane lipoprotein-sorting protein
MCKSMKLACLFGLLVFSGPAFGKTALSDPYVILEKHFEAVGGFENLQAMKTMYQEGTITIEAAGLRGIYKQWTETPLRLRQETDFEVMGEISGDNGQVSWHVDANGKLLIQRDETTLKARELRRLMAEYEYTNPESEYFTLTFDGVEKVNDKECYAVRIANTINKDIQRNFYDKSNFYLLRTDIIRPDNETRITYSDFREVEGFILPFKQAINELPTDEMITVEYSRYDLNPAIDVALFEPPAQDVEDFVFKNGESAENAPVRFIDNHIYLPVNIMGKERLWVLDCGASVNVIDSSFAAQLGLPFEGPVKGQGASGVVDFYFVTLPSYSIDGIQVNEQKVVAFSFRQMFHEALGLDVVGILGYDFLSRFVTKIDYAKQTISFYHPDRFEYEGAGAVFESPLEGNMLSLPVVVDEEFTGKWGLDIGAPDLDFHYPYARDNGLLNREGIDVMIGDAAGITTSRISKYRTIRVGDYVLKEPLIATPAEEGTGAFSQETRIGNIGNSLLRNFVLYLDYDRQRVILEKGDDFGRPFSVPKSGLQFMYNADDEVEVRFVSPGTPADDAGLKQGDIIKTINGIDVQYFDGIIALRKLMRAEVGTTYEMGIVREGKMVTKQITLRDIL